MHRILKSLLSKCSLLVLSYQLTILGRSAQSMSAIESKIAKNSRVLELAGMNPCMQMDILSFSRDGVEVSVRNPCTEYVSSLVGRVFISKRTCIGYSSVDDFLARDVAIQDNCKWSWQKSKDESSKNGILRRAKPVGINWECKTDQSDLGKTTLATFFDVNCIAENNGLKAVLLDRIHLIPSSNELYSSLSGFGCKAKLKSFDCPAYDALLNVVSHISAKGNTKSIQFTHQKTLDGLVVAYVNDLGHSNSRRVLINLSADRLSKVVLSPDPAMQ